MMKLHIRSISSVLVVLLRVAWAINDVILQDTFLRHRRHDAISRDDDDRTKRQLFAEQFFESFQLEGGEEDGDGRPPECDGVQCIKDSGALKAAAVSADPVICLCGQKTITVPLADAVVFDSRPDVKMLCDGVGCIVNGKNDIPAQGWSLVSILNATVHIKGIEFQSGYGSYPPNAGVNVGAYGGPASFLCDDCTFKNFISSNVGLFVSGSTTYDSSIDISGSKFIKNDKGVFLSAPPAGWTANSKVTIAGSTFVNNDLHVADDNDKAPVTCNETNSFDPNHQASFDPPGLCL